MNKILIAHAKGDEIIAERIASGLYEAGYEVFHRGTVMVGESIIEEASKLLQSGVPVILCGTVKALGTEWAHRVINAARQHGNSRVFGLQVEKEAYLDQLLLDSSVAHYWLDPSKALGDLVSSLQKHYPPKSLYQTLPVETKESTIERYRKLALETCDIIDLANLPESDRFLATKQLELRRLYVPLRVWIEVPAEGEAKNADIEAIEKRRVELRRYFHPWLKSTDKPRDDHERASIGERLAKSRRLVVLGDPGAGKTTLVRWIATAYLLKLTQDPTWSDLPDISSLPDENWLPIIIRCRDLDPFNTNDSLEDILSNTLRKTEFSLSESHILVEVLRERLLNGDAILMFDGLDEIADAGLRTRFCQQIEQISIAYPLVAMIITSRIVGYRELGYQISRGFEHLTIADLTKEDKNDFAQRWCFVTELPHRRDQATKELIHDIHSAERIERLTGNPMLLTTLALVKRKIGRLPSRRADLYWGALEVLLNWRREVDEPIDHREAIPQLEYLAYSMCARKVVQLREDEILDLLDKMRDEYPQIHSLKKHSSDEFLHLLERRTGILIEAGHIRHLGRPLAVFEFRHLTFQEYMAGLALVDGRYPDRDRTHNLSQHVGMLSGNISDLVEGETINDSGEKEETEKVVSENWREAIRLCVSSCNDDDVDAVLTAILAPAGEEDASKVSRARAVQAALCLADDPNCSEETAQTILRSLADNIVKSDGSGNIRTSLDAAVKELAMSRWKKDIHLLLLKELRNCGGEIRYAVGGLCGSITEIIGLDEEKVLREYMVNLLTLINSENEEDIISASLQIVDLTFNQKAYLIPGLIEALFSKLNGGGYVSFAVAWALRWLCTGRVREDMWTPNAKEIQIILGFIKNPATETFAVAQLINIVGIEASLEAVEVLIDQLTSSEKEIKKSAIKALGRIGDASAISALIDVFDSANVDLQKDIISALGKIGGPEAGEQLISLAGHENAEVRKSLTQALGFIKSSKAIDPLISIFGTEDVDIQASCLYSLGWIGDLRVGPTILSCLNDPEVKIRKAAIWALGKLGDVQTIETLIGKLQDDDKEVKAQAAQSLGAFKSSKAVEPLISLLDSEDNVLRNEAIWALGNIKDDRAVRPLIEITKDSDSEVRSSASRGLGELGDVRAVESLVPLLSDKDLTVKFWAIDALSQLKDKSVINQLRPLLKDEDEEVQVAAAGALGHLDDQETIEALFAQLGDANFKTKLKIECCLSACAFNRFDSGNIEEAAHLFESLILKSGLPDFRIDVVRNNFAYCCILLGRLEEASEQFDSINASRKFNMWPLYKHNHGILSFLNGQTNLAKQQLRESLQWITRQADGYDSWNVDYMLVLNDSKSVISVKELPVTAAILINLFKMGEIDISQLQMELAGWHRVEYLEWLKRFAIT
ncbi:MAG TPA: HEAT repeat domain-containing protein [Pyrinomonadaceae bacterium]|jgi:HEAT repeat protein|nr:HEAT repeat domain-containing protein [Pyrinomonadaceae bacterium]